jgi:ABC-type uncharacterized transport system auxiliary subunit
MMLRATIRRALALLPLAVALSSCAAFKAAEQPVTLRLSPTIAVAAGPRSPESVAVAPVRARGFTGHSRYAYVDPAEPAALREAQTLFWEEPPAQAVERALVDGLRMRFATVTGTGVSLRADRRVNVVLTRFEEESGPRARAVVAIEAMMLRGGTMLRAGTWCAAAPIGSPRPTDRARAFEAAMAAAVAAFVQAGDGPAGDAVSGMAC